MTLPRSVEPEWLDDLPASDRRAIRSRRDLKRVNRFMLQTGIMTRLLAEGCRDRRPRAILELGAGDGNFMLTVARRLAPRWPGVRLKLLDRQCIVSDATLKQYHALGWQAETIHSDVFDFFSAARVASADVVTANLFLHHFQRDGLARLLAGIEPVADVFAACEPARAGTALVASRLLWAIGCNDVSRHDAVVSVRAGFRDKELSELWPNKDAWELHEGAAFPFTHGFLARRRHARS
jgi:hypothetical protein